MADLTYITGYEPETNYKKQTQVYMATHEGENYLPFMNRSFISFSFGERNIEDYNLIATISGNRMQRQGMAEFEDLVTTYDILDGQFYWGTVFKPNSLDLTLSTDGITQAQLDDFLFWFQGGQIRELILAEHPNRAIMARVAKSPTLSLLPFEEKVNVKLGERIYTTSTTLYKGDIELSFVMDEPFWYSKINIFGRKGNDGVYYDTWTDANGRIVNVLDEAANKDALKIIVEDGIPFSGMLASSMIFGNNTYANYDSKPTGKIARNTVYVTFTKTSDTDYVYLASINEPMNDEIVEGLLFKFHLPDDQLAIQQISNYLPNIDRAISSVLIGQSIYTDENQLVTSKTIIKSKIDDALASQGITSWQYTDKDTEEECIIAEFREGAYYGARITGPHMDEDSGIPSISMGENRYFYYCGTAPSPLKLTFTMTPTFIDRYIATPNNHYAQSSGNNEYNTITIESVNKSELIFTTPGIYTSYNKVIYMFKNLIAGQDWAAVREAIRQDVHHADVRAWANRVIDSVDSNSSGIIASGASEIAQMYMQFLFRDEEVQEEFLPGTYTFDSKTGKATACIQYRKVTAVSVPSTLQEWLTYGTIVNRNNITKEEDVGDMLKSNYLIIRDRNYPDENNTINHWSENNKTLSYRIYHDVANGLKNIVIEYKNLYL